MTFFPKNNPSPGQENLILLVDDDPVILELLKSAMATMGYACDTARDGEEAKNKLKQAAFTLVLTDIVMPGCDGIELLRHIKEQYPRVEVIVLTGYAENYSYTEVVRAGASDFITKPFSLDELEAKVKRVIREQLLIKNLEHLSMCDMLTDLYNRRYFEIKIHEEAPRSVRQGHPLYLALIDADRFKGYNDCYGHQAGDLVLQRIGKILVQSTRENVDLCFRLGGDEFAIIIPHTNFAQTMEIANRVQERYRLETHYPATGLSLGIAGFVRRPGRSIQEDIDDLVARADKALYACKKKGGGQVVADTTLQLDAS